MPRTSSPTPKTKTSTPDTRDSMRQMLAANTFTDSQYRVLFIMFLTADKNGEFFLSQKDMMHYTKLKKTAVWQACKDLEAKGYIERTKLNHVSGNAPRATEYRILWGRFAGTEVGRFAQANVGEVRQNERDQVRDHETQEPYKEPSSKNPKEEPKRRRVVIKKKATSVSVEDSVDSASSRNSLRNGSTKKTKGQVRPNEPGSEVDMLKARLKKFPVVDTGEPKTLWEQDNEWIV